MLACAIRYFVAAITASFGETMRHRAIAIILTLTRLVVFGIPGALWPEIARAHDIPLGEYDCWFYSTHQPLHNFNLAEGSYTDARGASGAVTVSGEEIHFGGGGLDGRTGIYRPNPSTISFVNADGEVILLCGLVRTQ